MSAETLMAGVENDEFDSLETILPQAQECNSRRAQQRVWCAPMTDAGEWVITWTPEPGAQSYEVQTSMDANQWSKVSRFSGTRAVLLLGPGERCWARVRAVGRA